MPPPPNGLPWAVGREDEFVRWMHLQLFNALGDQASLETMWIDRMEQWRAELPSGVKEFPWPGASNLSFPLTAIHTDPIYADFMQTFHAAEFWHVSPLHGPAVVDSANALRKALSLLDRDFLRMREVNAKQFLYTLILGTGIYKTHYVTHTRRVRDRDLDTGEVVERIVRNEGPAVEYVPLNHFVIPGDAWNIDPDAPVGGARWVAQKFYLTPAQLRAHSASDAASEFLPTYDKKAVEYIIETTVGKGAMAESTARGDILDDAFDSKIRDIDKHIPSFGPQLELFEVWARFDIDNDGIDEDVVVIWHQDSDTILRATTNPFDHGQRPFERIRYLEGFGFYGIGLAEKDEWAQATLTKLLNAQIDNVMLANTRMLNVPRGTNLQQGEAVYPGKVWATSPGEEIKEVRLGDIYQSLPQIMGFMLEIAESASGASDLRQGNIQSLPSRTPAATTLSMLAESNKRFDEIMSSMRMPFSRVGVMILQLMSQQVKSNSTAWDAYFRANLGEDDAKRVMDILTQNVEQIGEAFGIEPTATSAVANKEADKQNFVGVLQLVSQVYPQLVQTALLLQQVPPNSIASQTALAAYVGGVELLKRLLERFDIQNPELYLPDIQQLQQQAAAAPPQAPGAQQPETQFAPLGGFFGPGPFQGAQRQFGDLLGLNRGQG